MGQYLNYTELLKIGTPEKKILISLCYYVVTNVFSQVSFTLATRNSEAFADQLLKYFICEQAGHDPSAPCDRSNFEQLAYPGVTSVAYALLSLIPVVNLTYAVNVAELRAKCGKWCGRLKLVTVSSTSGTSSSVASSKV